MKNKKKLLLAAAAVTVMGGALLATTTSPALAQTVVGETHPMSSLAQKIADKFGLNKDEVQAVFDQERAEMEAKFQTEYETRLSQLVTDGKITEAQKQLIAAKHAEMKANRQAKMESFKNMTESERKTAMETERTALEAWATANGIEVKYLMFGHGHGPMKFIIKK